MDQQGDPARMVLETPELLEHILSFVRGPQALIAVTRVCRTWRDALFRVTRGRCLNPWPVLDVTCDVEGIVHGRHYQEFQSWLDELDVYPSCVMVFVSGMELQPLRARQFLRSLALQMRLSGVKMLLCSGHGIFTPRHSIAVRAEQAGEYPVALQIVPESEDICAHVFECNLTAEMEHLSRDEICELFFGPQRTYPQPKAVFLFSQHAFEEACGFAAAVKTEFPEATVCGGLTLANTCTLKSCDQQAYGLVISGDHLKAVSCLNTDSPSDGQEVIRVFSTDATDIRPCMAVLVSCVGRLVEQLHQPMTEQTLFEYIFPDMQGRVSGFFSGGEICFESRRSSRPLRKRRYNMLQALHQYTTCFAILGFQRSLQQLPSEASEL
eukprot:m.122356 g.122356  ORF g.122356 m.122356 type:complete len:381 (-) comp15545_c0_seq2:463-1605(-)